MASIPPLSPWGRRGRFSGKALYSGGRTKNLLVAETATSLESQRNRHTSVVGYLALQFSAMAQLKVQCRQVVLGDVEHSLPVAKAVFGEHSGVSIEPKAVQHVRKFGHGHGSSHKSGRGKDRQDTQVISSAADTAYVYDSSDNALVRAFSTWQTPRICMRRNNSRSKTYGNVGWWAEFAV
jgi:hypothetical protein